MKRKVLFVSICILLGIVSAGKVFTQTSGGEASVDRRSSVASAVLPDAQSQLVQNGSFEVNTDSWMLRRSPSRSTTTAAEGGVASLRIETASSSATQVVAIVSGKTYDLSVYVYVASHTSGKVGFDTRDQYDAAGQGQFVFNKTNGGWKKYTGSFTATNNSVTLRTFSDPAFDGTAYFDRIELRQR